MPITFLHCPVCEQGRASRAGTLKRVRRVPAPRQTRRNLLGLSDFFSFVSLQLGVQDSDTQSLGGTATPGQLWEVGLRKIKHLLDVYNCVGH